MFKSASLLISLCCGALLFAAPVYAGDYVDIRYGHGLSTYHPNDYKALAVGHERRHFKHKSYKHRYYKHRHYNHRHFKHKHSYRKHLYGHDHGYRGYRSHRYRSACRGSGWYGSGGLSIYYHSGRTGIYYSVPLQSRHSRCW